MKIDISLLYSLNYQGESIEFRENSIQPNNG